MNCMTPRAFGALGPVAPGTGAAFHGLAAPGPFRGAPYAGLAAPGPFRGAAYGAAKTGPGAQAMQSAAQSGRLRMPPVAEAEAQHVFDKVADVKRGVTNPQAALQAAIGAGAAVAAGLAVAIAGEREAAVAVGAAGVFGALGYYMWQSGLAGDLVRG